MELDFKSEKDLEVLLKMYHAPFVFCLQVWMQFAFTGQATVNCKIFRSYSLLRTELQLVLLKAYEKLTVELPGDSSLQATFGTTGLGKKSSSDKLNSGDKTEKGNSGPRSVTALQLAEMLCSTFSRKPATSIALETDDVDDEDAALGRILLVMTSKKESLVIPLQSCLAEWLHLPLTMHVVVRGALEDLAALGRSESTLKGVADILAVIKKHVEESFPFTWLMFALDVVEIYNSRGFFPQNTQEAGFRQGVPADTEDVVLHTAYSYNII